MSVIGSRDTHTNAIAVYDKVLFSCLVLPPPNYSWRGIPQLLSLSSLTTIIGSLPPLRGGDARGDTLYIPHIPSEACPPILSVDVEET
jgi:hypothetical protein